MMVQRRSILLSELAAWRRPPLSALPEEQLELGLFRGEPWGGRSPRGLTRAHLGVILKPRGKKSMSAIPDPMQLELPLGYKSIRKKGRVAGPSGALTLLPLPWEVSDG